MFIGIDFDNTIVSYDDAFYAAVLEQGLIPSELPRDKTSVRDHLRATGREQEWTVLQGVVYGRGISKATLFPGVRDCLDTLTRIGVPFAIISHKTRYPYMGERVDLRDAAMGWLVQQFAKTGSWDGIPMPEVFFADTKLEKMQLIHQCGCTHFIDDLPEFLLDQAFPPEVTKMWFSPNASDAIPGVWHFTTWADISRCLVDTKLGQGGGSS